MHPEALQIAVIIRTHLSQTEIKTEGGGGRRKEASGSKITPVNARSGREMVWCPEPLQKPKDKGIVVQVFHTLHLKKCSLMEGLIAFCNTLTSSLTQKSASAIRPGWNLQLYAVLPLQKKGGAGADGGMSSSRAAQKSEWLGSQLILLRLPCQRPVPKAILGYLTIKTCIKKSQSTSTSWSTVLSKTRLEGFI